MDLIFALFCFQLCIWIRWKYVFQTCRTFLCRWLSSFRRFRRLLFDCYIVNYFIAEFKMKTCFQSVKNAQLPIRVEIRPPRIFTSLFTLNSHLAHIALWNETCGNISITIFEHLIWCCVYWWRWTLQFVWFTFYFLNKIFFKILQHKNGCTRAKWRLHTHRMEFLCLNSWCWYI